MIVQSVRNIDVDHIIKELDAKANMKQEDKKIKGRFYEVVVNKQLLIDACDALRHYRNSELNPINLNPAAKDDDLK